MKSNQTISIDSEVLKKAKEKIENISLVCERALKKELEKVN